MSNSFPLQSIANEPPPLDQSDDDDDDSEEFRDFSGGLKFDIDPSPMSTPRKSKSGNLSPPPPSVSIPKENSSPETVDSTDSSLKKEFDACNNNNSMSATTICDSTSNMMKTSYIGTLETEPEDEIEIEEKEPVEISLESEEKIVEQVVTDSSESPQHVITPKCETSPTASQAQCSSNFHSLTDDDEGEPGDFEEFQAFELALSSLNSTSLPESTPPANDDEVEQEDFEEFQAFEPAFEPALSSLNSTSLPISTSLPDEEEEEQGDFEEFQAFEPASSSLNSTSLPVPTSLPEDDEGEEEDFEDFQAFEPAASSSLNSTSIPVPTTLPCNNNANTAAVIFPPQINIDELSCSTKKSVLMETKFESIVKSLFVTAQPGAGDSTEQDQEQSLINSTLRPIDKELKEDNAEWSRVEDFEGSQGLLFKWLNSVAYEKLLHSLKIDRSSIVYSNKWGAIEVPRFAASLVDSPLLPESFGSTFQSGDTVSDAKHHRLKADVKSSDNECANGNIPAHSGQQQGPKTNAGQLSQEASEILTKLPDLSFMRAKTLVFPAATRTRDV